MLRKGDDNATIIDVRGYTQEDDSIKLLNFVCTFDLKQKDVRFSKNEISNVTEDDESYVFAVTFQDENYISKFNNAKHPEMICSWFHDA